MAIIAVAGESSEVDPQGTSPTYSTYFEYHIDTESRVGVALAEGTTDKRVWLNWSNSLSEGWTHFVLTTGTDTDTNLSLMRGYTYTGGVYTEEWRIAATANTGEFAFYTWDGTTWIVSGNPFSIGVNMDYQVIDVYFKMDATNGEWRVYNNGILLQSYTGGFTTPSNSINAVRFTAPDNTATFYVSQIIVADESTLGFKLITLEPTADSSVVDWVGSYTNIDAANYVDEASPMTSDVIGAKALFTGANVDASFNTLEVKAVVVSGVYSVTGGGTVTDLRPILNTGGLDFTGPLLSLPNTGELRRHQEIWHNNPNTSTKWTIPEVDALTYGALTA